MCTFWSIKTESRDSCAVLAKIQNQMFTRTKDHRFAVGIFTVNDDFAIILVGSTFCL